jgi:hypothetical protein
MGTRDRRDRRRTTGRRALRRGPGDRTLLDPKVVYPWEMGLRSPEGPEDGGRSASRGEVLA